MLWKISIFRHISIKEFGRLIGYLSICAITNFLSIYWYTSEISEQRERADNEHLAYLKRLEFLD